MEKTLTFAILEQSLVDVAGRVTARLVGNEVAGKAEAVREICETLSECPITAGIVTSNLCDVAQRNLSWLDVKEPIEFQVSGPGALVPLLSRHVQALLRGDDSELTAVMEEWGRTDVESSTILFSTLRALVSATTMTYKLVAEHAPERLPDQIAKKVRQYPASVQEAGNEQN